MRTIILATLLAVAAPALAAPDLSKGRVEPKDRYDQPEYCSKQLAIKDGAGLKPDQRRRCIIAVAQTYIDAEEMSIPFDKQIAADDLSRHLIGTPKVRKAGALAEMVKSQVASSPVILAIRNRRWLVDGNDAWIYYNGFLKEHPEKGMFDVMERITVENGKITEIFVAGVATPR